MASVRVVRPSYPGKKTPMVFDLRGLEETFETKETTMKKNTATTMPAPLYPCWSEEFITQTHGEDADTYFVTLKEDVAQDSPLRKAISAAHQGGLPNDWVYGVCEAACIAIEAQLQELTGNDDGMNHEDVVEALRDASFGFAEQETEVYTGMLFRWAGEHFASDLFSLAEEDAEDYVSDSAGVAERIRLIQHAAINRIYQAMVGAYEEEAPYTQAEVEEGIALAEAEMKK